MMVDDAGGWGGGDDANTTRIQHQLARGGQTGLAQETETHRVSLSHSFEFQARSGCTVQPL